MLNPAQPLPVAPTGSVKSHKLIAAGIQFLIYLSVFLGGFIVAKLHTLFMSL